MIGMSVHMLGELRELRVRLTTFGGFPESRRDDFAEILVARARFARVGVRACWCFEEMERRVALSFGRGDLDVYIKQSICVEEPSGHSSL